MFERIFEKARVVTEQRRTAQIDRLAKETPPPGVTITRTGDGVTLSGKHLRRRLVTDVSLRSFGR